MIRRRLHRPFALAVVAAVAAALLGFGAAPADAGQGSGSSILSVSTSSLPAGQTSTVTVNGSDYLVPPHAPGVDVFGGVYVFFGWVAGGAWGPSARNSSNNNGSFGYTYSYRGDSGDGSTRDDGSGRVRLVSFTTGGISGSDTPFHMDDNGNWTTTLTIEGSTYTFTDPATGQPKTVNCQQTQCGVFTIGAHGIASATNERFVPIGFAGAPAVAPPAGAVGAGGAVVADGASGGGGGGGGGASGGTAGGGASGAAGSSDDPSAPSTVVTGPPATTVAPDTKAKGPTGAADDPIELAASNASSSESSSSLPVIAGALVLVLLLAGGGTWCWRRRHAGGES
jgi:hypothetical protein